MEIIAARFKKKLKRFFGYCVSRRGNLYYNMEAAVLKITLYDEKGRLWD